MAEQEESRESQSVNLEDVELSSVYVRIEDLPSAETWTFTLSGGSTVTKSVAVY